MKNNKKTILSGSMIAGALIGLSSISSSASDLTSYSALGSGADVRSELLGVAKNTTSLELTCGEGKDTKTSDSKTKDGKCGEGKCGEGKKAKKEKKKEEKSPK